jgi:nitroreductase
MSDFLRVLNERTSIQHWRFIAVTDQRIKERLKETTIAPNQERVAKCSPYLLNPW